MRTEIDVATDVGVEQFDEVVEIASGACRDEALCHTMLFGRARLEAARNRLRLDVMPRAAGELPAGGGSASDDRADRVERELAHVVQHEHGSLGRRQLLEHYAPRDTDGLIERNPLR